MESISEVSPPNKRRRLLIWVCCVVALPSGRPWRRGEGRVLQFMVCIFKMTLEFQLQSSTSRRGQVASAFYCRKGGAFRRQDGVLFNLQTGGPSRCFSSESPSSCWQVVRPCRRQGGRRWRLIHGGEDRGHDRVSFCIFEVLYANMQASLIISFLFIGLFVRCTHRLMN
jgi:hypothetical protein